MALALYDPVHGVILLDRIAAAAVDTPHFQRLRQIRQLGTASYVYPSATHTRFEHCLGVYHITRRLLRHFLDLGMKISPAERKVVQLAALCHDLGHGPFSHLFDNTFLPAVGVHMSHEDITELLVKDLFRSEEFERNLNAARREVMKRGTQFLVTDAMGGEEFALDQLKVTRSEVRAICRLVQGQLPALDGFREKPYLATIVSNPLSGLDMDRLDYLLRDARAVGLGNTFDLNQILLGMRPMRMSMECGGGAREERYLICHSEDVAFQLFQVFHTRYSLFKMIYHHRTSEAASLLVADIFVLATGLGLMEVGDISTNPRVMLEYTDEIIGVLEFRVRQELRGLGEGGEEGGERGPGPESGSETRPDSIIAPALAPRPEPARLPQLRLLADLLRRLRSRSLYSSVFEITLVGDGHPLVTTDVNSAGKKKYVLERLRRIYGEEVLGLPRGGREVPGEGEGRARVSKPPGAERPASWDETFGPDVLDIHVVTTSYGKGDKNPLTYLPRYRGNVVYLTPEYTRAVFDFALEGEARGGRGPGDRGGRGGRGERGERGGCDGHDGRGSRGEDAASAAGPAGPAGPIPPPISSPPGPESPVRRSDAFGPFSIEAEAAWAESAPATGTWGGESGAGDGVGGEAGEEGEGDENGGGDEDGGNGPRGAFGAAGRGWGGLLSLEEQPMSDLFLFTRRGRPQSSLIDPEATPARARTQPEAPGPARGEGGYPDDRTLSPFRAPPKPRYLSQDIAFDGAGADDAPADYRLRRASRGQRTPISIVKLVSSAHFGGPRPAGAFLASGDPRAQPVGVHRAGAVQLDPLASPTPLASMAPRAPIPTPPAGGKDAAGRNMNMIVPSYFQEVTLTVYAKPERFCVEEAGKLKILRACLRRFFEEYSAEYGVDCFSSAEALSLFEPEGPGAPERGAEWGLGASGAELGPPEADDGEFGAWPPMKRV